jgi:hypothetical protein
LVAWKRRWNTRNSATAGTASTTAPARMAPNGLAWRAATVEMKLARATASGCRASCLVTRNGQRNSFQGPMKVTITAVRMAGLASGMAIRVRIFSSEAPSRRADSNSSLGSCMKNWRKMNTAVALTANGRIMPR